jgi:hypothetical protein
MVHLTLPVVTIVFEKRRPSSGGCATAIGITTKVETGNVHSIEFQRSSGRR